MTLKSDPQKHVIIHFIQVSSPNHYGLWNALSVETLAGDLIGAFGQQVSITIHRIHDSEDILPLLKNLPTIVDMFGISVEIGSLPLTEDLVDGLKKKYEKLSQKPFLVFGNTIPTYNPKKFLSLAPTLNVIVVRGEGEIPMRGITQHLISGASLEQIPSIEYRINGQTGGKAWRPQELNELIYPPTTDTIDSVLANNGNAIIETSRGCPWSECRYCSILHGRKGRKWEPLPIKRVIAAIDQLVSKGIRELEFVDADFLGDRFPENIKRLYQIASAIEKISQTHQASLSFRIFLTPHMIHRENDPQINKDIICAIKRLINVGLSKVYLGVESGCNSQLERYKKGNDVSVILKVVKLFREHLKIPVDIGFLMFDPDTSIDEIIDNIKFYKQNNLIQGNQWPFRAIRITPKTSFYSKLKNEGRLGEFDGNLLCYEYKFTDRRVQRIFDAIDSLSAETRDLFYAVKSISKLQFSNKIRQQEAEKAHKIVTDNAEIYLDLLESMSKIAAQDNADFTESLIKARKAIDNLVREVSSDIKSGVFKGHKDVLSKKIDLYFTQNNRRQKNGP